jgi:hypothetical protein
MATSIDRRDVLRGHRQRISSPYCWSAPASEEAISCSTHFGPTNRLGVP